MAHTPDAVQSPVRWGLFALAVATIAATLAIGRPWLLSNTTPSEPPGLYLGTWQPPKVGRIVAFHAPAAAFPYADTHMGYLRRVPLLKAVAAGPGDHVCTTSGRLVINGEDRAPIARVDGAGRALPRWSGCRVLGNDEFFVFSDRVRNSFDSRYYGPVPRAALLGVYVPLTIRTDRR
jgi:conjugative transfer signal peptidase TraF